DVEDEGKGFEGVGDLNRDGKELSVSRYRGCRGWRTLVEYGLEPPQYAPGRECSSEEPQAWLDFMMK
ncbi:hypothetical protein IFM89_033007, partial [Coptis chinensis]